MTNLIGLYSSAMGAGKTTLTNGLMDCGWVPVKFASVLKDMLKVMFVAAGIADPERYTDGDLKEQPVPGFGDRIQRDPKTGLARLVPITCRHLMQTLGTEWGRQGLHDNIWVDLAKAKIRRLLADGNRVVVDDMRFPNEYDAIEELGGKTVRIHRPGTQDTTGHASEGKLDNYHFDFLLVNGDSKEAWEGLAGHFHDRLTGKLQVVS